jgi:putative oxidoreductase
VLLGGLFCVAGIRHFYILPAVSGALQARGVPFPKLTLIAGSLFELIAGGLLMLGLFVTPAALGLVLFTLGASVMLLNFWDMQGEARGAAVNGWQMNLAVMGGLLIAAARAH